MTERLLIAAAAWLLASFLLRSVRRTRYYRFGVLAAYLALAAIVPEMQPFLSLLSFHLLAETALSLGAPTPRRHHRHY